MKCGFTPFTRCRFQYNQRYTPEIYDTSPNQVTFGELINIYIDPKEAFNKVPLILFPEIKLGDRTTEWQDLINSSNRPGKYKVNSIPTRVGDNKPAKSVEPDVNYTEVGRSFIRETAKHCNFSGNECWTVRVHPKIDKISASKGYLSGGQTLEITGFGLSGQDISVKVDNVSCLVNHSLSSDKSIICETGSKVTPSLVGVSQPGNYGVSHSYVNPSDEFKNVDWSQIKTNVYPTVKSLKTTLETIRFVYDEKSAHSSDGWFYAPETGQYKFYLSSDDETRFYIDVERPYNSAVPYTYDLLVEANLKAYCYGYNQWRQYEKSPSPLEDPLGKYQSDWLNLEAGQYYRFSQQSIHPTNRSWSIGSVEFTKAGYDALGHQKASKAIQNLRIESDPSQAEKWTITCDNVPNLSNDEFILSLTSANGKVFRSAAIRCRSGALEVFYRIASFFNNCQADGFGICSNISVYRNMFTSAGIETTDSSQATKYVFTTYLKKRINGTSFISYEVTPVCSITSTVTVSPPYDGGNRSSGAISGSFKIRCPDPEGDVWTTRANVFNLENSYIQSNIDEDIPWLRGRVSVHTWTDGTKNDEYKFFYRQNGVSIYLTFDGLHFDPPQCTILSDDVSPMTIGNEGTLSYVGETTRHYGTGLMFEPVGLDFMYTDAQNPQVKVKVDGLKALCTDLNCDYAYEESTAEITAQTYDPVTQIVNVQGTSLPITDPELQISLGGATCGNNPAPTLSDTLIVCTLSRKPSAGLYKVQVKTSKGLVGSSLGEIDIPLVVNALSPSSVNPLGGDLITINGEGFPDQSQLVTVGFDDNTDCVVKSTSYNQIVCQVAGFSNNNGNPRQVKVQVLKIVNADGLPSPQVLKTDESQQVGFLQNIPKIVSIDKLSVSPILKQALTFTLDAFYTDTLNASDLRVELRQENSNYSCELYVMSVNDSIPKQFTVNFNGAPIGQYTFYVEANSSSQYGQLGTEGIVINTVSTITNVSPLTGSVLGGTVLTIQGTNFGLIMSDQTVTVGNYNCDILTAQPTELTCRIRQTNRSVDQTSLNNEVIVFFAAASEATCEGLCMFTFAQPLATVDSTTPAFNPATNNIEITVAGAGFQAVSSDKISLLIDGIQQNLKSVVSDTSMIFTLTNIEQQETSSITILFEDGYPANYRSLTPITFTPSFASVTPNSGIGIGGTLIQVSAPGIGVKSTQVNLISSTNSNLCTEVKITQYGSFTCLTRRAGILSTLVHRLAVGNLRYDCANSDPNLCTYQQAQAGGPSVTTVNLSAGNIITFGGSNFPTGIGFKAEASYQSMTVQISTWTANQVIASFPLGIPFSAVAILPKLYFTRLSDGVVIYALNNTSRPNPITVTAADSTSSLSVSYAGGLYFTVTKTNVYATLLEKSNRLEICGNVCKPIGEQSDKDQVVCMIPALATTYSVENYQIVEPSVLTGTWTANSALLVQNVFDGDLLTEYSYSSGACFIQLTFPEGQVGVLDSAKVYINTVQLNRVPFTGNTVLQGFDGVDYVDIWRLDDTINEGWNAQNYPIGSKPAYSAYRWKASISNGCRFGEVVFTGIFKKSDAASSTQCTAKLFVGTTSTNLSEVTYTSTKTPQIDSIVPRYGRVSGGDLITINGDNFVDGFTTVTIDMIPCDIQSVTTNQITCLTGERIGDEPDPSFVVFVENLGLAVNQGNTFTYVHYWSELSTWGNAVPPQFGEAVSIPKGRTLVVDVDRVPQLSFVLVEGGLIFPPHTDPNHQRTFDAGYIFIKGGWMEVGTEEQPYTSKLTITMHGDVTTPAIPTFGNKNIAVMDGMLSMIGQRRSVVWTLLDSTVLPNATQITLQPQAPTFDWAVGEQIVIAPTSFNKEEAEVRTIITVGQDTDDASKPVLTLDRPLLYKHYAATETYGVNDQIEMRAEVGLLSRNVKFRGDPETSAKNQYGAHIILYGHGEETTIGKIMYIELTDVGQAFKMGRYPIHFCMLGRHVTRSIVQGNSVHQTYNRGIVLHAVSLFRVIQNVFYNTMGHAVFFGDALETKNIIEGNLVIKTNRSWSLLNVDQTPASFWITNPDNTITNNSAASSDHYGFWFDLEENPTGPFFTKTICPINTRLGEFKNNVAHSNGRYGLRIFVGHVPRANPCGSLVYDNSNPLAVGAPYPSNPVIPAIYEDFTSWKNVENGAIVERTGAVIWKNFKIADNMFAGMEWSLVAPEIRSDGFSMIDGALVIGKSGNTEEGLDIASPRGIIGPRSEWFTAQNIKFYSFDFINGGYALGDCSRCFSDASTDSGARTITVKGLQFDDTVTRKIKYEFPYRGIFLDADGSLTGLGAGSWASANFKHNQQPECQTNLSVFDGQICDNTVQVRRVAFHNTFPTLIKNRPLYVAKFDDSEMALLTAEQLDAYKLDLNNYSSTTFTRKLDPVEAWALPYVTGHKYRWFFGQDYLDIERMKIEVSPRWQPEDKYLLLNLPYRNNREHIDIYRSYNQAFATSQQTGLIQDGSLSPSTFADWESGFNSNDKFNERELDMVITGNSAGSKTLQLNFVECRDNLAPWCAALPPTSCTGEIKLWSDITTWPSRKLPVDGENVTIPSGVILVFDLEETPVLNLIKVDGCLEFLNTGTKDQHLKAYQIFVDSGTLNIGSEATPYARKAKITLYGDIASQTVTMTNAVEAGNKLIANNGEVKMYGQSRQRMSRLLAEAQKGATTVTVETGLDWVAGDMLGFAATGLKHTEAESATILSYDSNTGIVVLTQALEYYHFGSAVSTASNYQGLEMRGEVILLTRNIVIQGDSTQNDWQGQFVTRDTLKACNDSTTNFQGLTILNNVEFNNMGQRDTTKAALRFENSERQGVNVVFSTVQNCVFHHNGGFAIAVVLSKNISVQNCDVFHAKQIGVQIDVVTNVNFDSVNVFDVRARDIIGDKETCIAFCTYTDGTNCFTSSYTNSIIGGCPFAGILGQGYSCTDPVGSSSTTNIKNIVVHSVDGSGASLLPNRAFSDHLTCYQFSHIQAYKNRGGGIGTMYTTLEMRASNIVLVDNQLGITLNIAGPEDEQRVIKFSNSFIYGENSDLSNDCPDAATGAICYCPDKYGFMNFHGQLGDKDAHIQTVSKRPIYNVKTDAIWDTKIQIDDVEFINFKSTSTACNSKQSAFGLSPEYSAEQIPIHRFFSTKFTNVHPDAIAYFRDPLAQWASNEFCGQFPCTGWSNVVINFYDAVFEVTDGVTPLPSYWTAGTTSYDFQLIGKVLAAGESYSNCTLNQAINGYFCANTDQDLPPTIGVLVFESLDTDSRTRTVAPVIITNDKGYSNTVNSFMDHAWEGTYTSQNRLSRFIAHVETETGLKYTVTYTGTPPKNMRYTLRNDELTAGVTIKVPYPDAGWYDVLLDGNFIDPQPWDAVNKQQVPINPDSATCGQNLYVGVVQNYLEFFVTPGCTVLVRPRDAILASVTLDLTFDEFFANCGVTTFVQNLASALEIDLERFKVISIEDQVSSVKVTFFILSDLELVETNIDGSNVPNEQTYDELVLVQEKIDEILTPTTPSVGTTPINICGATILEVYSEIIAEIMPECQLTQEECPQPWTVVDDRHWDYFKCAKGKKGKSISSSGKSRSSSCSSDRTNERCNYIALPELDSVRCECVCNQDPDACPANAPYFDPSLCACVCPNKNKCKKNFTFREESCSCACDLVDQGCPSHSPTLDKKDCKCECKQDPRKCPRNEPDFNEDTCSCTCKLNAQICALKKTTKRFDAQKCACVK